MSRASITGGIVGRLATVETGIIDHIRTVGTIGVIQNIGTILQQNVIGTVGIVGTIVRQDLIGTVGNITSVGTISKVQTIDVLGTIVRQDLIGTVSVVGTIKNINLINNISLIAEINKLNFLGTISKVQTVDVLNVGRIRNVSQIPVYVGNPVQYTSIRTYGPMFYGTTYMFGASGPGQLIYISLSYAPAATAINGPTLRDVAQFPTPVDSLERIGFRINADGVISTISLMDFFYMNVFPPYQATTGTIFLRPSIMPRAGGVVSAVLVQPNPYRPPQGFNQVYVDRLTVILNSGLDFTNSLDVWLVNNLAVFIGTFLAEVNAIIGVYPA
ncbi:MAG: hypothetical protein QW304_07790 [Thermoproteota archaeon]